MLRRSAYCILILCLCLMYPGIVLGKGAGGTAGNNANASATTSGDSNTGNGSNAGNQEMKNNGETSQVQNQAANQNQANKPVDNPCGTCEQLLKQTRDRLQIMLRDQMMKKEDWASVEKNLLQLKNNYQNRTELRQEIWNTFEIALQNVSSLGTEQDREKLLREMISLEPRSAQTYRELGSLFRNRGEVQCHLWCNGSEVQSDVTPVISQGRTLVPISALSRSLGARVEWRQEEQTVLISKGDTQIRLQVQNRTAFINGQSFELDVPAAIYNSRLLVPIGFCARAFHAELAYYPEGRIVAVNQN